MCGIAGTLSLRNRPASVPILQKMTDSIRHRGPNDEGQYVDRSCGLGHRRLAIIDLSAAAHQPMSSYGGRFVITYSGEIYNFKEIRAELESSGVQFKSRSDSEVAVNAFEKWGLECIHKFNGMFAFAMWDRQDQVLYLVRDRFGIKPLYYTLQDKELIFGSEIKALLAHPTVSADIDQDGLVEYFTFQNFFTSRNLFKNVSLLPAGHYLKVSAQENSIGSPVRYWDFEFQEDTTVRTEEDYRAELKHLFEAAVSRQLVGDVPVGSYLSGGVDSGSITMVASSRLPQLDTFTVGFDLNSASGLEIGFDERVHAEQISYLAKSSQYEMVLKAGDMERCLSDLVWHLEEPRVGQSYPNFYASQLASKFVRVVLAGTGGDELFGGYPWRYYRAVVSSGKEKYLERYYDFWQRLVDESDLSSLFRNGLGSVNPRDLFAGVFDGNTNGMERPEDCVNQSLYFESKTFLHSLLVVEDKLSMAHSLETRVPFLDQDLVDFAMKLPVKHKLGKLQEVVNIDENDPTHKRKKYYQKTRDGKLLLRQVMESYLPKERSEAVKQGFSAPDESWFRGESIEYVKGRLFDPGAKIYDYLDPKTVQRLVLDHLEKRKNRRLLIWSLLYFEEWCRRFLKKS